MHTITLIHRYIAPDTTDLNGDGNTDVITLSDGTHGLQYRLNDGSAFGSSNKIIRSGFQYVSVLLYLFSTLSICVSIYLSTNEFASASVTIIRSINEPRAPPSFVSEYKYPFVYASPPFSITLYIYYIILDYIITPQPPSSLNYSLYYHSSIYM